MGNIIGRHAVASTSYIERSLPLSSALHLVSRQGIHVLHRIHRVGRFASLRMAGELNNENHRERPPISPLRYRHMYGDIMNWGICLR